MVFLTYWKYVGYENGVAEVAVFFAKKFFIQHSKDKRGEKGMTYRTNFFVALQNTTKVIPHDKTNI